MCYWYRVGLPPFQGRGKGETLSSIGTPTSTSHWRGSGNTPKSGGVKLSTTRETDLEEGEVFVDEWRRRTRGRSGGGTSKTSRSSSRSGRGSGSSMIVIRTNEHRHRRLRRLGTLALDTGHVELGVFARLGLVQVSVGDP